MIICDKCGHDMSHHLRRVLGVWLVIPCQNCFKENKKEIESLKVDLEILKEDSLLMGEVAVPEEFLVK